MVTPKLEHWLCKGALEQRLNCMTVGIIQWTRDYVYTSDVALECKLEETLFASCPCSCAVGSLE